jgi:agmatine deiminase
MFLNQEIRVKKTILSTLAACLASLALNACGTDGASEAPTSANTSDTLTQQGYSVPAQWERHDAVWLGWWVSPYGGTEFPTENLSIELVQALSPHVPIDLIVQDAAEEVHVHDVLSRAGVNTRRVRFHQIPHNDFWLRDTGGVFTRTPSGEVSVLDWGYDFWSYANYTDDFAQHDERIDRDIAAAVQVPAFRCSMIHEGGNADVDGNGTAIVTESVARRRNPFMNLAEMTRELRRCYGLRQVIWIPDGLVEDQAIMRGVLPGGVYNPGGTDGHIDEFIRFAPNNTVLLAEIRAEDINRIDSGERQRALINRDRLEAAYRIMRAARDANGRPYRIVRMPVAEPDYYNLNPGDPFYDLYTSLSPLEDGTVINEGDRLRIVSTTSYLNFFVSNGVVVVPTYAFSIPGALSERKDREAIATLRAAFPGRRIVPLQWVLGANRGAGGPHCMTQQQPASTNAVSAP